MPICAIQQRSVTGRFVPIQIKILIRRGPCFDKHNFMVCWLEWQVKHLQKNLCTKFKHANKLYTDGDNVQILLKPREISSENLVSDHVTFQNVTEGDCNDRVAESGRNDHVTCHEIEGSKKDACSLVNGETLKTYVKQNNELYRDSCGHAYYRQTTASSIVTSHERETCLSKHVCGSCSLSTSCSPRKKLSRKKRHKHMLKRNVVNDAMKEGCYHGENNLNTSVLCSAQGKKQFSSTGTKDVNKLIFRFLPGTTILCVQLILLLLLLTYTEIFLHIYSPMMAVHNEMYASFIQPRRALLVNIEVFKCSLPEVKSFVQCGDESNGLVMVLLLLLAGDVEVNPGPGHTVCEGMDSYGKELNYPDIQATGLREFVYIAENLKTIRMLDWKQLPEALWELDDLEYLMIHNYDVFLEQIPHTITKLHRMVRLEIGCNCDTSQLFPMTCVQNIQQLVSLQELGIAFYDLSECADEICSLTNLQELTMENTNLSSLPADISALNNLRTLHLRDNMLASLPEGISALTNLQTLYLTRNKLTTLPEVISALNILQTLYLSNNKLTSLPDGISGLKNLQILDLSENKLTSLPEVIGALNNLQTLNLKGNLLTSLPKHIRALNNLQTLNLSDNKLKEISSSILQLKQLQDLDLSNNNIKVIPSSIQSLQCLKKLKLYGNPVTHLAVEISCLPQLQEIKVIPEYSWEEPCPLVQPPIELCKQGTPAVLQYLKDLKKSAAPVKTSRQTVHLTGESGGGKTSLTKTLCQGQPVLALSEERTKVVEQVTWRPRPNVQLLINDFGGHSCYKVTHTFFFTPKGINIHVFNLHQYEAGNQKSFDHLIGNWLRNLQMRVPQSNVTIVGTHSDLMSAEDISKITQDIKQKCADMEELRLKEIDKRLNNIKAELSKLKKSGEHQQFLNNVSHEKITHLEEDRNVSLTITEKIYITSCKTHDGIKELEDQIVKMAVKNEIVLPESWFNFVDRVSHSDLKTGSKVYLSWNEIESIHRETSEDSSSREQIEMKIFYMRDAGQILYYTNANLCDYIFHDIKLLIKVLKALFTHDIDKELSHHRFSDEFCKQTFEKCKQEFTNNGILEKKLLFCLWQKVNISEDYCWTLIELLKMFDLCYEVLNCSADEEDGPVTLLFPWFLRNVKHDDDVPKRWCGDYHHQLIFEFDFWPRIPVNFFEISLVLLHKQLDRHLSRSYEWENGALVQQGSIKVLFEKSPITSQRQKLMLSVRGENVHELWQHLLPVFVNILNKLQQDWPGTCYEVYQLCPHCVNSGMDPPHMYPKEILQKEVNVNRVPCDNACGDGMIDASLVCPPRELQLRYGLVKEKQGCAWYSKNKKEKNEELHRELILKIQDELIERDFGRVKFMCKAYLKPAEIESVTDFCALVEKLVSKRYAVSWQHEEGYSKLVDVFKRVGLPKIVELVEEYGSKY